MAERESIALLVTHQGMGASESHELSTILMGKFLTLLVEMDPLPKAICFYSEGVKLACEGSPVLEELRAVEGKGARLVLCNTCLNFYGLAEKVRVGIVGGMGDIISVIWAADKVITI
jgi:hypothetical protein